MTIIWQSRIRNSPMRELDVTALEEKTLTSWIVELDTVLKSRTQNTENKAVFSKVQQTDFLEKALMNCNVFDLLSVFIYRRWMTPSSRFLHSLKFHSSSQAAKATSVCFGVLSWSSEALKDVATFQRSRPQAHLLSYDYLVTPLRRCVLNTVLQS